MKIKKFKDLNEGFFTSKEFEKEFKKLVNIIIDNFDIKKLRRFSFADLRNNHYTFKYFFNNLTIIDIKKGDVKLNDNDITDLVSDKDINKLYIFFTEKYNNENNEIKNNLNKDKINKIKQMFSNIFTDTQTGAGEG